MTIGEVEKTSNSKMRLYWAAGRGRELPGDQNRAGLADMVHQATVEYATAMVSPGTSVTLGWMKRSTFMIRSN